MRKILLASTAIASTFAVASAHAEVSISGGAAMSYQSVSDDLTRTSDETLGFTDNTVTVSFSSVTDSGLALSYSTNLDAASSQNASISGDFGTIAMSNSAHAAESFDVTSPTMVGGHGDLLFKPQATAGVAVADVSYLEADLSHLAASSTDAVLAYYSPSVNGFAFGASTQAIGTANDVTSYGVSYTGDMGGASFKIGAAAADGAANNTSNHMGISLNMGDLTMGVGSATVKTAADNEEDHVSYGVTYNISDAVSLNAGHVDSQNSGQSKDMTTTSIGVSYTIATGLTAHIANNMFDYKVSNATVNDGSIMSAVIKMSF
jgi:hypothetical protein